MIQTFKHKGLKLFFTTGSTAGIQQEHAKRLRRILAHLNAAEIIETMNIPGYRLHQHKGERKGIWSVDVSGNYRVFFRFEDGHAYDVDYGDPY